MDLFSVYFLPFPLVTLGAPQLKQRLQETGADLGERQLSSEAGDFILLRKCI